MTYSQLSNDELLHRAAPTVRTGQSTLDLNLCQRSHIVIDDRHTASVTGGGLGGGVGGHRGYRAVTTKLFSYVEWTSIF